MAPQPAPGAPYYYYGRGTFPWWCLVAAVVLFILAAFAAGGHPLADIPDWTWGFAAAAAVVLSRVVP